MSERLNDLVRNLPVATFYYKGSHSHPVRREILVVDQDRTHITGYELREGHFERDIDEAPIKTFLKDKIATRGQCRPESTVRKVSPTKWRETTLARANLHEALD